MGSSSSSGRSDRVAAPEHEDEEVIMEVERPPPHLTSLTVTALHFVIVYISASCDLKFMREKDKKCDHSIDHLVNSIL